ncbi:MAG: OmpA family protein [Carboxylicivirga sp.]|jgi:outer membrane protein OmpA-like peptidoglycan-associated protein|nr:OmpA family protein [Carboxylicivirga sp.]
MKQIILLTIALTLAAGMSYAQVKDPKKEVEKQGTKRVNSQIESGVDKSLDKLEEGIGSLFGKKKKKKSAETTKAETSSSEQATAGSSETRDEAMAATPDKVNVSWSKFDFVPGDKVIFSDGPDIMEENGEFPSRWDTDSGQSEIASVDGENVILFIDGNPKIMPYLKNANEDYLPDVFTIEFDLYRAAGSNRFFCQLYDTKNQRANNNEEITIGYNYISCGDFKAEYPGMDYTWHDKSRWMHISIAYTKGKLKMYMDDVRLINIPRYAANPTGFTLNAYFANHGEGLGYFVKNVRIAKGGVKYYDRVMQDGKIICNGIRFDVNKATLKPESMGPINKICELMQKKPEIKFSVEGHTDSDGDDNKNQQLSEQRAQAVMQQMVAMGISADRLSSKGFGESQPIDNNATPEGKANNRRVEFVVQ